VESFKFEFFQIPFLRLEAGTKKVFFEKRFAKNKIQMTNIPLQNLALRIFLFQLWCNS